MVGSTNSELVVTCGRRDERGRMLVTARYGTLSHVDRLDPLTQFSRSKLREAIVSKFGLPDDAHELLEAQILGACNAADAQATDPIFRPVVTILSTVQPRKVEWLWQNRIAIGKNNLLCGDPGLGKSLVALDIAARVSSGNGFPDAHDVQREPSGVVILTMEDDAADTIVPRLLAHGADLSRIALVQGLAETDGDGKVIRGIDLLHDIESVIAATKQVDNCKLVIVDTISDYITGKTDSHKNADVRAILNPFAAMANDCRLANLLISHFRKGDGRAVHAAMGSIAFVGQSRVAWAITRCPTNPRRRLMTTIKNNLADDSTGLAFQVDSDINEPTVPVCCWEAEPLRMSAEEAMAHQSPRGRKPHDREEAEAWLRRQLIGGSKAAADILEAAAELGFNRRTVQRAFATLGCTRHKNTFKGGWIWALPEDDTEDDSDPTSLAFSHPRHLRENPEENQ